MAMSPTSAAISVALAVLADRRLSPRSRIAERLPGYLITDGGQRLMARNFDVSATGLGFVVPHALPTGSVVVWIVDGVAHKLDLVRCEGEESGNYRIGLRARESGLDLYAVALAAIPPNTPPEWGS